MSLIIRNGKIVSTSLGNDDHGPSSWVYIDHDEGQQGFGGYGLRHGAQMSKWVLGILDTLEAQSWENLPGVYCRIRVENGLISAIGHIVKEKWFVPAISMKAEP